MLKVRSRELVGCHEAPDGVFDSARVVVEVEEKQPLRIRLDELLIVFDGEIVCGGHYRL